MYRGEPIVIYNLYGQFAEIAELLADTLRRRGYPVIASTTVSVADRRLYVLFGNNVWEEGVPLPPRYIIYQLEQHPIEKWFTPSYFARMSTALQVWDYNLQNVEYLQARGIDALHVPIGYSPIYDAPRGVAETVEILFLGQLTNGHRQRQLEHLRRAGLTVTTSNNLFGEAKKRMVAQAKLVLNLHYTAGGRQALLEEARLVPLLSAGKVVISEAVADPRYMELYRHVVVFVQNSDELLQQCLYWLRASPADRQRQGQKGLEWIRQRSAVSLFPWAEAEEQYPSDVPYYDNLVAIPDHQREVLVSRLLYPLLLPEWRVRRHFGDKSWLYRSS